MAHLQATRRVVTTAAHWTERLPLPRHIPFLSHISVCKKIGLGYVPAVAFMVLVALVAVGTGLPLLPVVIIGTAIAGVASVSAMLTAFSVGERVRCVLVAAEAGARGDLDQSVEFRPSGDEVDRLAASFNEMTSELRRRLEAEQAAREDAQRANAAKSQFLLTMSHELRTPLTVLIGSGALLEESAESRLSPSERRYLAQIQQNSEYLIGLVNESLNLARVEAGDAKLELEVVTLDEVLCPVFDSVGPLADDRQQYLALEGPGDPVHLLVDGARVRQVLYNLATNAIKFTQPGGSVTIGAAVTGVDLMLKVSDTGIGIPIELHDRVFQRFERLHGDRIKAPGVGLGLAVTKSIVELCGGEITFESSAGSGTTFFVHLPGVVTTGGTPEVEAAEGAAELAPAPTAAEIAREPVARRLTLVPSTLQARPAEQA
jgi:signal transduction histidine kinase